ncbi:cobyrinic acid a,c-diamide synthase [Halobaculum gomorrense]|uniref:Cobyrinate a,c-diamide synthase n=1 Tax=Halobaculum gomorrense TaxID=43928 RepID=A0A1M5JEL2_9EURY|nr:cobyrinic acid a,c-diamide synthase [Halobaculum gomorrense]SHG38700.1 hydrogenobyrinic acid a,c-diamide synthase (glutamine-hydrolysing) /cobyrinate a,c-diamide synthase [Halobaculum gomorrense]
MRGLVLGGTASGVGKTVAALAAIRALDAAGYAVQPAKAGPDFIDPSHHEAVAGTPSRTLDAWLQGEDGLRRNYRRGEGDLCVVEGVMGLYDGDGSSTAMVAEALDLPVVLVVDAKAGMESVAATALGFREYAAHADRDIEVAGVIAQRAHGGRHERGICEALPEGMAYLGRIPPDPDLEIPDRHLGLHMGDESPLPIEALDAAADHLDAEALAGLAREPPRPPERDPRPPTGKRVAVADDAAFAFSYPATLECLRERAEVATFAPTRGDALPDCDAVYLPGGYPELHAPALADSDALDDLADRAAEGLPVLGECGGLMALAETLTTADGDTHEMAGVLPADVRMHDRYQALDHVELRARGDTLTARAGEIRRGHEFHYSSAEVADDARFAFEVERGDGIADGLDGLTEHRTLGTYAHVHPESGAFDAFLEAI